ncbi:alpha/beta hydrolase [Candidatus Saccharibacteria bacterium]|nr:alpha/beta hydrolase [Candidatus Saccharibacteria bacterium]
MKIVIFHGTDGSPEGNWFPWLKTELTKLGHEVYVPKLPTPENQSVNSWCKATQEQVPFMFGKDTILVGHSLGAVWVCEVLSHSRPEPVKASFFVSGGLGDTGNEFFDSHNREFMDYSFDWQNVRKTAGHITMIRGDDDPYVSAIQAKELASKLGVKPILVQGGGHLNAEFGYTKFPYLLDLIKKEL